MCPESCLTATRAEMIHNNFLPGRKVFPRAKLLCFAVAGAVKRSCRLWELLFLLNPITERGGEQGLPCSSRARGTAAVPQPSQGSRTSHTGLSWVCSTSHRGTWCTQAPLSALWDQFGSRRGQLHIPEQDRAHKQGVSSRGCWDVNGVGNTPHCF